MLAIPDIVRRSRERLERMNEEGRMARLRATQSQSPPKWAIQHKKPFTTYGRRNRSILDQFVVSELNRTESKVSF